VSVLLAGVAAALFGVGTYLILQRQLSRIVIGVGLMGHGGNVLFVLAAQGRGRPAFVGDGDAADQVDPLPQSLALTAVVITFAVTAFLLALAYRSWVVTHDDEVEDAIEDRLVARRGADAEARVTGGPLSDSDPVGADLTDPDVEERAAVARRRAGAGPPEGRAT
jgi:multicomponent Na+:H+ antiporter subunit C